MGNGDTRAAIGLLSSFKLLHLGMAFEVVMNTTSQFARAVTMDDPDRSLGASDRIF